MKLLVVFRRFYRTVAFALFVSSLYCSLTRYFKNIPIQSSSSETFPAYELPTILICEKNQFDWEAATAEGYHSFKSFYTGLVNGSAQAQEDEIEVSWGEIQVVRGMGRLTLIQKLFKSDGKLTFGANVTAKDRFILPQGHCKGIKAISGYEDINPLVIEYRTGLLKCLSLTQKSSCGSRQMKPVSKEARLTLILKMELTSISSTKSSYLSTMRPPVTVVSIIKHKKSILDVSKKLIK